MIIDFLNEGDIIRDSLIISYNLKFNTRDYMIDEEGNKILKFVGIIINADNDIFVSYPKHFKPKNNEKDMERIIKAINKHIQRRPELYFGNKKAIDYKSNYPFAFFYAIYEYYKRNGLFLEEKTYVKSDVNGKVNWKYTINQSNIFFKNGKPLITPLYHNYKSYYNNFLTECMGFVINYTIDKFHGIVDGEKININVDYEYFITNKKKVVHILNQILQKTFNDDVKLLIQYLMYYFNEINIGGEYYIKHYTFSSIWEDMVGIFLNRNFYGVEHGKFIFKKSVNKFEFTSNIFRPNLANINQFIQPDYFSYYNGDKYIFDAKYYLKIEGMNYKQISYYLFLSEYKKQKNNERIYCALIMPSERNYSEIHFQMKPEFSRTYEKMMILECYIDIRNVILFYLGEEYDVFYEI